MSISENGLNLIKRFEGLSLTAYRCPAGVWTIGYGHTGGVSPGMSISEITATDYLRSDCNQFERAVRNCRNLTFTPNQNQFDALVSFTYNCGEGCLNTLVNNRSARQVADALLLYNKAGGRVLPGLVRRREEERALFLSGEVQIQASRNHGNDWVRRLQAECNAQGFSNQNVDGLPGPNTIRGCPTCRRGARGGITRLMQEKLASLGYNTNGVDGIFGGGTFEAIKRFQSDHGLGVDGIIGQGTWRALIYA